jgi:muramoyltetrapeptide carboxypeptidase
VIRPPRVRPGDVVRLVAPSGPVPEAALRAGVEQLGARYRVRYEPGLLAREGYLAGPDERRLDELRTALADPEAAAVLMARGGYGVTRLLPFLDPELLRRRPKPVVGFSDGTALLAHVLQAGLTAVHGPTVAQLPSLADGDRQALYRLLEDPAPGLLLDGLTGLVPGRVQGPLLGGNLEVFSRLVGTPFMPDVAGAILVFEDLGERPYRIDRLVTHLDLAGVFSAAAGVVLGDFSGCREPEATRTSSPTADEVLEERFGRLAIPVATGAPVGHGSRNVALPFGALVELDTRFGTLAALEGAVS